MSPSSTSSSDAKPRLVGADDVILVPEDLVGGRRVLAFATSLLFVLVCVATLVVDVTWPVPKPRLVGAELTNERAAEAAAKFSDGSLAAHVERSLRMTSRVRRTFGSPYALALYQLVGAVHGDALAGRDGWLFMHGRTSEAFDDAEALKLRDELVCTITAIARRVEALGTQMVVLPVPRREVWCAEHLPVGLDARPEIDSGLVEQLRARGVTVVDLLSSWPKDPDAPPMYFKVGSHWTIDGELAAAEATARAAGLWKPEDQRRSQLISATGASEEFDLLTMAGVDYDLAKASIPRGTRTAHRVVQKVDDGASEPENAELVVVGTSFTAERTFTSLLSHFCDEPAATTSEPGGEPSRSLLNLVRRRNGKLPRTIAFEVPVHMAFQRPQSPALDALLAALPTPECVAVAPMRIRQPSLPQLDKLGRTAVPLAVTLANTLPTDGDGSAHIRLRGKPGENGVLVAVRTGTMNRNYFWPHGVEEYIAPIFALGESAPEVQVLVSAPRGPSRLEFQSAEIVAFGTPMHAFEPLVATQRDGIWVAALAPAPNTLEIAQPVLSLRFVQPSAEAGDVAASIVARRAGQVVWRRDFTARPGESNGVFDLRALGSLADCSLTLECSRTRLVVKAAEILGASRR